MWTAKLRYSDGKDGTTQNCLDQQIEAKNNFPGVFPTF